MYIEPSLCGPGPLENFVPDENNNKPRLLTAVFEEFFSVECEEGLEEKEEDDSERDRNILLLSGPAGALVFIHRVLQHKLTASCSFLGSGKSTAYLEAIKFVLGPYTEQRKRAGYHVVLLPVSLPTLQDPLGGIFKEGVYYCSEIFL